MDANTAKRTIEYYISEYGFPDSMQYRKLDRESFNRGLNEWSVEYMEAIITYGKALGYIEHFSMEKHGKEGLTEWGYKVQKTKETIAYRRTTEGKKEMLRAIAPETYRTEDDDVRENMRDISVDLHGNENISKKQLQLNIERMQHIQALEKSISRGGALRDSYDRAIKAYQYEVDHLMTNEEADAAEALEKKRKSIPAFIVASLVMPFYVLVRAVDYTVDSAFWNYFVRGDVGLKLGGIRPILDRLGMTALISAFLAGAEVASECRINGSFDYFVPDFVLELVQCMLIVTVIKAILSIAVDPLSRFLSRIVAVVSCWFESKTANDYQMGSVSEELEFAQQFEESIKEREAIIADLREAIEKNLPYCHVDTMRKRADLSLKELKKMEEYNEVVKAEEAREGTNN